MLSHIRFYKTARVIVLAFGLLLVLLAGALYLTAQDPGGSAVMAVPR